MNLHRLMRLFAALAFSLPIIACAAPNEEAINLDPILGRWYPTSNVQRGPSPFLDISEDEFIFEGAVTYQMMPIGVIKRQNTGRNVLVFRITGTNRVTEYGYGCGSSAKITYISIDILPSSSLTFLEGDRVFIDFYRGNAELANGAVLADAEGYEFAENCFGVGFRRKETLSPI